ncbi:MAG: hypothetical protein AABW88_03305 [Nanoarchaeota archaeon]
MTAELNCNGCRSRVGLASMKYSKDGKGLICESCYNKQTSGISVNIKPQTFNRPIDTTPKKKIEFFCKNCSFKWSRALDFRGPKLCPGCGRNSIMYNLPNDADELLRELDKMDNV